MARNTRDDIDRFHTSNIYIPTRTLFMGSEHWDEDGNGSGCDGAMAEKCVKNLHILESMSSEPINILMDNLGGDEYACFAIIDAIQACKSKVTVTAVGHVMSAGSLILQAADERVMGKLAVQMLHYGTWACNDHSKTFQKWAREGERIDKWMEKWYLSKIQEKDPQFSLNRLKHMLDHDTFLTAEESLKLGLCDRVLGGDDE